MSTFMASCQHATNVSLQLYASHQDIYNVLRARFLPVLSDHLFQRSTFFIYLNFFFFFFFFWGGGGGFAIFYMGVVTLGFTLLYSKTSTPYSFPFLTTEGTAWRHFRQIIFLHLITWYLCVFKNFHLRLTGKEISRRFLNILHWLKFRSVFMKVTLWCIEGKVVFCWRKRRKILTNVKLFNP